VTHLSLSCANTATKPALYEFSSVCVEFSSSLMTLGCVLTLGCDLLQVVVMLSKQLYCVLCNKCLLSTCRTTVTLVVFVSFCEFC